jgi:hypothetical protein
MPEKLDFREVITLEQAPLSPHRAQYNHFPHSPLAPSFVSP